MRIPLIAALLALAPFAQSSALAAEVAPVNGGVATIGARHLAREEGEALARVLVDFPGRPSGRRLANARPDETPEGRLLARMLRGGASGNHGDLYDNRDGDHSTLALKDYPTLGFVEYADDAKRYGYGPNARVLFNAPTIGNSSTAIGAGAFWRSQGRALLTGGQATAEALASLYAANHLYVYPEHRDHDPERGDLFPAATPHFLMSQGSSGSDRPILRALAMSLAALPKPTKSLATQKGLIAPILQMLLRRSMNGIESDADYLSGRAHLSAFDGARIDFLRLLQRANALRADEIPPRVMLKMEAETPAIPRVTLLGDGDGEALFDTPDAIARIARGAHGMRRYRISAADTVDPNGRPLRFEWRVLRGPGARVEWVSEDGRTAEIVVPWHERYAVPGAPGLLTNRVDIGVFAHNGAHWSAPAFFSVAFPPAQRRSFDTAGRPVSVDYAPPDRASEYSDPAIFRTRRWRDDFTYSRDGRFIGWTRTFPDGRTEAYSHHGLRILSRDAGGRPLRGEVMAYALARTDRAVTVTPEPAGQTARYVYAGPDDRLGRVEPETE